MVKAVSLNNVRVLKLAGLLVLGAMAIAFFAFPMVSFAVPPTITGKIVGGKAFRIDKDGNKTDVDASTIATLSPPTDASVILAQIQITDVGTDTNSNAFTQDAILLGLFRGNQQFEVCPRPDGAKMLKCAAVSVK
jgi:hypothetical protein